jgi:hypothetical protein
MLALKLIDDEPAAPAPKPDKATLDRREINRRAVKYWSAIHPMIFDQRGKPVGCAHLNPNPNYRPNPDGQVRYGEPRLAEFSGVLPYENEDGSGPAPGKTSQPVREDQTLFRLSSGPGNAIRIPRPIFCGI